MMFRISGLSADPFRYLYGLPDEALTEHGVIRYHVDEFPGFPDRIEMRDAKPGETVLLLNHVCQPANSPYKASHAIFVLENAEQTYSEIDVVPDVMCARVQSLRAFDSTGMMVDADIADGAEIIEQTIERFLGNPRVSYIHAHNAKPGCYSGRIDRV